jgi:hypothetical protein
MSDLDAQRIDQHPDALRPLTTAPVYWWPPFDQYVTDDGPDTAEDPWVERREASKCAALLHALDGVDLSDYDRQAAARLAVGMHESDLGIIVSWLLRARAAGR